MRIPILRHLFFSILVVCALQNSVPAQTYDWVLIYYMPYDNNLSDLSSTIVGQMENTHINAKSCILLQTDLAGEGGMTRYAFHSTIDTIKIESETSASSASLNEYLQWAATTFKAKHYAIVLLNHGGGLDEYGIDEHPTLTWMPIHEISNVILAFNQRAGIDKLDLFFQQVCTRGTLENGFQFRHVADYTLFSQGLVPAPSYYYPSLFSNLSEATAADGAQLADFIIRSERNDMYYSYTLIKNRNWNQWRSVFANYTTALSNYDCHLDKKGIKFLTYADDIYFDFESTILAVEGNDMIEVAGTALIQFTRDSLIDQLYINPHSDRMSKYHGLSICSPFRDKKSNLELYQDKYYDRYRTELIRAHRKKE
jgi:hypothetical protein